MAEKSLTKGPATAGSSRSSGDGKGRKDGRSVEQPIGSPHSVKVAAAPQSLEEIPPKCEACEAMVIQEYNSADSVDLTHAACLHARIAELERVLRVVASDIQLCGSCEAEARRVLGKEGGT